MAEKIQNQYRPDKVTPPGETLQDMLDAVGMSQAELADRIGKTPKTIVQIIKQGGPITPVTAMELEKVFSIPASFWNSREQRYRESLARTEERKRLKKEAGWLKKLPIGEMIKAGWIEKFSDTADQANEVLRFFGVATSVQWEKLWLTPDAAYRKSKAFTSGPEACSAWLRKGELEARKIECSPYNKADFFKVLKKIRSLTITSPDTFSDDTIEFCAGTGVAVVFTPAIKGVSVYGATRWLTPKKAMIQLSLRGKYEDMLWFTFFHECAHILKHGKKDVFIESDENNSLKENEADKFAADLLISPADWRKVKPTTRWISKEAVINLAQRLDTSPAIIVGRLQHEGLLPHTHLNGLRRKIIL